VVRYKRKIIASLLVVLVGSGVISLCSGQAVTKTPPPAFDKSTSLFTSDPNFSTGSDRNLTTRELFYKMMFAVLLVVAMGTAAIYISKKLMPRITNLSGKKIQVCETVHLGSRKAVHLIKIGNRQLLIGSTNESISKLADVTDALAETDLSAKTDIE